MRLWLSAEAGFAVGGQASAALIDGAQLTVYPARRTASPTPTRSRSGADLLEFLNATSERAADESCHVQA
jgi:hypothetical protein